MSGSRSIYNRVTKLIQFHSDGFDDTLKLG